MQNYLWISHPLNFNTPAYGGKEGLTIVHEKKIVDGHNCNSLKLIFSNHLGTHVDVPYHFIESGKKINDYLPDQWIFHQCGVIEIDVNLNDIITLSTIKTHLDQFNELDFLLIKTGFEKYRTNSTYWQYSPAYSDDIAYYLKEKFPTISAIGFDTISLTGYQHRELGKKAHQTFLAMNIRIFEDLHLNNLTNKIKIDHIIALPLRFDNADGAPCTMLASIKSNK